MRDGQIVETWSARADEDGTYQFQEMMRSEDTAYFLGAEYSGVVYLEPLPSATEADAWMTLDLTVYEPSNTDPGLRFERSAWILQGVDAAQQAARILEVYSLVNTSDRTFLPTADGPGGSSGLLVFGLPAHASGLTPHLGLDPARIEQIDRGFASLEPVRPGRTEIAFSYQFPYSESRYVLRRTIRYPVESLRVLGPAEGPAVRLEGPAEPEVAEVGGRQYQGFRVGPLEAGSALAVSLEGLPARSAPLGTLPQALLAALGAGAGVAAIVGTWWRRSRLRGVGEEVPGSRFQDDPAPR
jgi:hypothetical protein